MSRQRLVTIAATATALGIGLLVLQRWVAQTRIAAMALVAVWFVLVGIAVLVGLRGERRRVALATLTVIAVASAGIGYWTAFRDRRVDEDVVVAVRMASVQEREAGLAARDAALPARPIRLAGGAIAGADGHTARGRATVVREPDGQRRLTLTDFDADPGPQVVVYLSRSAEKTDDVIDLGGLKGNVGDQQYRVPDSVDLRAYDTVILWCVPFTTRIAVAPLA